MTKFKLEGEELLKPLRVSLKSVATFGTTKNGMLKSFGAWDEYLGKRYGDYILFPFRALSDTHIGKGTPKSMKFRSRDVLVEAHSKGLFNELPVYLDHEFNDSRKCVGIVFNAELSEPSTVSVVQNNSRKTIAMPYGVDVLIGIHHTETKLVSNVTVGALSCMSITMYTHYVRSHTDIATQDYDTHVGTLGSDGKEVYREAVFIEKTEEVSLLRRGADPTAVKYLIGDEKEKFFSFSGSNEGSYELDKKVTILHNVPEIVDLLQNKFYICNEQNLNLNTMDTVQISLTTIVNGTIKDVDAENSVKPDTTGDVLITDKTVVVLANSQGVDIEHSLVPRDSLLALQVRLQALEQVEVKLLNDLRDSITSKYTVLKRTPDTNVKSILEGSDFVSLNAVAAALNIQLADHLQPFCNKCSSGSNIQYGRASGRKPDDIDPIIEIDATKLSAAQMAKIAKFLPVETK